MYKTNYKQIRLSKIAASADEAVIDCLKVITVPNKPVPRKDELLLRVRLSAIHPCDLLCSAGLVSRSSNTSGEDNWKYLPGMEAVASIEEVGSDLEKQYVEGQRVCVKAWSPWGRWQEADGVWSEYLVVKRDKVILVPDEVNDVSAATFVSISVTAYVMLICELELKRGDWLIQAAAGSSLGRWVLAFAKEMGINVISLVRREDQVQELKRDCAAEHVYCCPTDGSKTEELVDIIKRLTRGEKVKGALDPISDGVVASIMLRVMSRYGKLLKFGALGASPMTLSRAALLQMSQEGLQVKGFSIQNWWMPDTPNTYKNTVFNELWNILKRNKSLNFGLSSVYSFEEVGEAIRASLGTKSAKVFLTPRKQDVTRYQSLE